MRFFTEGFKLLVAIYLLSEKMKDYTLVWYLEGLITQLTPRMAKFNTLVNMNVMTSSLTLTVDTIYGLYSPEVKSNKVLHYWSLLQYFYSCFFTSLVIFVLILPTF